MVPEHSPDVELRWGLAPVLRARRWSRPAGSPQGGCKPLSPAKHAQWLLKCQPAHWRVMGLIPGQGHLPGWQVPSLAWPGACGRQPIEVSLFPPPTLPPTLHGKNTLRVRIKNKNSVIASKYGLPWDTRGCCLPPILDLGTLKKLVSHKTAWRDSAGPGGIFAQNLPSLGRRLHRLCDPCAVSPHELGVLTCFGECKVAVAMGVLMAHPGPAPMFPVSTATRGSVQK